MVEKEDQKVSHYELLYIIPVKYTVEELPAVNDKVKSILAEYGCQITYEEEMGKKKLAYPIKGVYHGFYFIVEFNMDTDKLIRLNRALQLMPEILRHLVVTKKEKTKEEITKERSRREQTEAEEEQRLKAKIKAVAPATTVSVSLDKPEEVKVKEDKKERGKVSIEDLDKKLDELIDESIL